MIRPSLIFLFISAIVMGNAQVRVETVVENINGSGGVNIAPDGNIILADFGQSLDNSLGGTQVWKITPDGEVSLFASGLNGASGNDFDSKGNLFQSNIRSGLVSKISPTGVVSPFASSFISSNVGIVIDQNDELTVCNCGSTFANSLAKVTSQGVSRTFVSGRPLFCPNGITMDQDGNIYVSNFSNGNIVKVDLQGRMSVLATTPGSPGYNPSNGHIIFSPVENVLYVASHGAHSIFRLTLDGQLTRIAGNGRRGNLDGVGLTATLSRPNGVALTPTGDTLYFNSSIPVNDVGGRTLNPSKLRRIVGLLGASSIVSIHKSDFGFQLFPNPVIDELNFNFNLQEGNQVIMQIHSSHGQIVKSLVANAIKGKNTVTMKTNELLPGSYFVVIGIGDQFYSSEFIKQ